MAPTTRSQTRRARPDALIKLLRTGRRHHDYTYTEGLNVCTQPWDNGSYTSGGFFFCELQDVFHWINLYPDVTEAAWVDVPADAQVARFDIKIKASKLVLTEFMPIATAIVLANVVRPTLFITHAFSCAAILGHTETASALVQAGADVLAAYAYAIKDDYVAARKIRLYM